MHTNRRESPGKSQRVEKKKGKAKANATKKAPKSSTPAPAGSAVKTAKVK
jgi:hypothetical protein